MEDVADGRVEQVRWWVPWLEASVMAGATLFAVGAAFHLILPILAPGIASQFEEHPEVFRDWEGWTRTYMMFHPFFYGIVFAASFIALRQWTAFPGRTRGGLIYGASVCAVGSLPVYLLTFAAIKISWQVALLWISQSLLQYTMAGMALACVYDGAFVRMSTILPRPARTIWELLLRTDTFLYITRSVIGYSDTQQWPARLFIEGSTLMMRVRLFGLGPLTPHHVQITCVNEARGKITTTEWGGLVRRWNHCMRVEPVGDSKCRYTDHIDIHAGLVTPLIWVFAVAFYSYRQRRWHAWVRVVEELRPAQGKEQ